MYVPTVGEGRGWGAHRALVQVHVSTVGYDPATGGSVHIHLPVPVLPLPGYPPPAPPYREGLSVPSCGSESSILLLRVNTPRVRGGAPRDHRDTGGLEGGTEGTGVPGVPATGSPSTSVFRLTYPLPVCRSLTLLSCRPVPTGTLVSY